MTHTGGSIEHTDYAMPKLQISVILQLGAMASAAFGIPPMTAGLAVLCTGLALYEPICKTVGGKGASFNPSQNFAFAAAGKGTFAVHAFRSVSSTIDPILSYSSIFLTMQTFSISPE